MAKALSTKPINRIKQHLNGDNAESHETVTLPPLAIRQMQIRLVGDSPLICHAWSEKAKRQMLDKQMKKAKQAKEAKSPEQDFFDSLYWLTPKPGTSSGAELRDARFGFPTVAFKSAAVDACSHIDGITKVQARGAFHIIGDMVEIVGTPTPREDMVKIAMGTADIRYRGEFREWSATLNVRYNASTLSAEQIVHLFNTSGFAIGIGEWRPQRDGSFGMFHVAGEGES